MHHSIDPGQAGVLHILAAPQIHARTSRHLDAEGAPDFDGLRLEAQTMSGGEALMVHVAADLWEATRNVGLADIVHRLDRANFARVVQALRIARGAYAWDAVDAIVSEARAQDLAA